MSRDYPDISRLDYEDLVEFEFKLNEVQAQKHHHVGAGIRFAVIKYHRKEMQYLDVDLKDVLTSGLPAVSCDEGIVCEYDIPTEPGVCRVDGAFFMVGGRLRTTELDNFYAPYPVTKWLWSAPAPPIAGGGSLTTTWTRCDTAMNSERSRPMVVPLHDGRIFICGGTTEPECWIEIYDPEKGEFDKRDLPDHNLNPNPSYCFLWADQSVMLFYDNYDTEEKVWKPSLVLYDVERNNWEIFTENLPRASQLPSREKKHLIYVGGKHSIHYR